MGDYFVHYLLILKIKFIMKKLFFLAVAMCAAVSMNAAVYNLCVVDTTSTDAAKTSLENAFSFTNATVAGKLDSNGKPYAEVTQTTGTTDWESTIMEYKVAPGLKFIFKDGNDNKLVLKCYVGYMQPNGSAVKLVVDGLQAGEKIRIVTTQAMLAVKMEGLDAEATDHDLVAGDNTFTLVDGTFAMYSKNVAGSTTKWRVATIYTGKDVEGGETAVENAFVAPKATKMMVDGQMVIVRDGVKYNALGTVVK